MFGGAPSLGGGDGRFSTEKFRLGEIDSLVVEPGTSDELLEPYQTAGVAIVKD